MSKRSPTERSCRWTWLPLVLNGFGRMCLAPVSAGLVVLLAPAAGGQPTATFPESSIEAKARRHPSYQVFAAQLRLPSMVVSGSNTLQVGELIHLELRDLAQLPTGQRETLANALEIPLPLVNQLLAKPVGDGATTATNFLELLRSTVTDYKYLQDWWTRFRPSPKWQSAKIEALNSLQDGELAKAWNLFLSLPRPAPPKNVRTKS